MGINERHSEKRTTTSGVSSAQGFAAPVVPTQPLQLRSRGTVTAPVPLVVVPVSDLAPTVTPMPEPVPSPSPVVEIKPPAQPVVIPIVPIVPVDNKNATAPRKVTVSTTQRRARPRVRRVTRVIRHVDPWSVFKVGLVLSMVLYGICLTAGVLLWQVAYTTGTIDNLEKFFESFGWQSFHFKGGEIFHAAWTSGLFVAVGLTGLMVLGTTVFNLVTDLVGGIRVSVLEEEVLERTPPVRRTLSNLRGRVAPMERPPSEN